MRKSAGLCGSLSHNSTVAPAQALSVLQYLKKLLSFCYEMTLSKDYATHPWRIMQAFENFDNIEGHVLTSATGTC